MWVPSSFTNIIRDLYTALKVEFSGEGQDDTAVEVVRSRKRRVHWLPCSTIWDWQNLTSCFSGALKTDSWHREIGRIRSSAREPPARGLISLIIILRGRKSKWRWKLIKFAVDLSDAYITVGGKLAHWLRSAHCEGLDILSHGTYLGCFEFEYRKLGRRNWSHSELQIKGGMMTILIFERNRKSKKQTTVVGRRSKRGQTRGTRRAHAYLGPSRGRAPAAPAKIDAS